MKKENEISEFQTAISSTLKAIAAKKFGNREIQFIGNTISYNSKEVKLSKISSELDSNVVLKTRGESDEVAIKLKYHDAKIHNNLRPNSELASQIFNLAEEARIESIAGKKFIGIKKNINQLIKKKYETNLINPPGDDDQTSFINALHLFLRENLSGSKPPENTNKVMNLWNSWLEKRVGKIVTQLQQTTNNQEYFGKRIQELLTALKSEIGDIENNDGNKDNEDTDDTNNDENSDDQDNSSQGESEDEEGDGLESGLDENSDTTDAENNMDESEGEEEDGKGSVRETVRALPKAPAPSQHGRAPKEDPLPESPRTVRGEDPPAAPERVRAPRGKTVRDAHVLQARVGWRS